MFLFFHDWEGGPTGPRPEPPATLLDILTVFILLLVLGFVSLVL